MAEIGDKVIVPCSGDIGYVVNKDKDFYFVSCEGKNSVWLCTSVLVHPDNEGLREQCAMMCD